MNLALFILIAVSCAVLFFRAADYEHMNPWAWAVASAGVTGIVSALGGSIGIALLTQAALFGVMWWYNMRRQQRKRR